jgi:hypothetical protein
MYVTIIFVIALVFAIFRLLYFLQRKLPFSRNWKSYTGYLLPVVEIASWIGVVIWIIRFVYARQDFAVLIILAVLVLLLIIPIWFLLRDFLFGVVLKLQRKIEVEKEINIEGLRGRVVKTGYFTFDILNEEGNLDAVPYNKVISKVITHESLNSNLVKKRLIIQFNAKEHLDLSLLQNVLINCPFVASSQKPIIGEVIRSENSKSVEVFVNTLKAEYDQKIQQYVEKHFKASIVSKFTEP